MGLREPMAQTHRYPTLEVWG